VKAAYALVAEPDPVVGLPSDSRLPDARGYEQAPARSLAEAIAAACPDRFVFTLVGAKVHQKEFLRPARRHGLDPEAVIVLRRIKRL
jgi:hypothetical protein